MIKKITIIGGTSGFGKWLAEFVLENFGSKIDLIITGRDEIKGNVISNELGCKFSNDNVLSVKDADIVVVSAPIDKTDQVIRQIGPHMKSGSILSDVTSVKIGPSQAMKESVSKDVCVIPTHPVFGPFVKNISGQVVVLTPDDDIKNDDRYKFLYDFLQEKGFEVIQTSAQEHDKLMSIIQGLTSFTLFVMGETLKKLHVDLDMANKFTSPIYKVMTGMIGRYMHQNPGLYADIQMSNDLTISVQKAFIQSSYEFNKIVEEKNKEMFVEKVLDIAKFLGENAKKGQNYTDKLIYLNAKQIDKIKDSIGKQISLENIYTKEKINDALSSFENNHINLVNAGKISIDEWIVL